jgi:hypothetical protein
MQRLATDVIRIYSDRFVIRARKGSAGGAITNVVAPLRSQMCPKSHLRLFLLCPAS